MTMPRLLFYLAAEIGEGDVDAARRLVASLSSSRAWMLGPPRFVDETDGSSCTRPEDEPIRTVGGFIELPPKGDDGAVERLALEDAEALIEAVAAYSREHSLEIEFQLGRTYVGDIDSGRVSHLLADGLLGEWRRSVEARTRGCT